ncbi:MAG: hypothetical protein AAF363_07860 [Bacteroidota bacterium]
MFRKRLYLKTIAYFFLLNMLGNIFLPTISYALTSGPAQPEFSSFEPVATTNMVNTFTGDFTYNLPVLEVPGPHGSGYPLSLSYHGGLTSEEEASWVGYGWSMNAGAINRSTRGFPDDYHNQEVFYHNKMPKNWTATVGGGATFEIFGKDDQGEFKIDKGSISASRSLRYNNYRGFGLNGGIGVSLGRGLVSMGYNLDNGEGSFSLNVNPMAILNYAKEENTKKEKAETLKQKWAEYKDNASNHAINSIVSNSNIPLVGSNYGLLSMSEGERPNLFSGYDGGSYNVSVNFSTNPGPVPIGAKAKITGSYSWQKNKEETTASAYGYMYSARATDQDMMDYHVEKESNFNKRDVFLGVPFNDADIFSATGEGIIGSFRLHHRQIGQFGPKNASSEISIFNLHPQVHIGGDGGPGVGIGKGSQSLAVGDWYRGEINFSDPSDQETDEPVFFRFSNDMGGSWGDKVDDRAVRAFPTTQARAPINYDLRGEERSGRSSYIGYNTNEEMLSTSRDRYFYKAYSKRHDMIDGVDRNDPNAIGELAVYNENGSRYVYALPVKSRNESDLSYGVRRAPSGAVRDNYLIMHKNEEVKVGSTRPGAYASAYLLTEITTSDYVDRSYDGPTPDDFGGYTKFNYDREYGGTEQWYQWRNPYEGLRYQRNSLSDKKDDLGSASFGEKEIYYLNSIETKTHIAVFVTETRDTDSFGAHFYTQSGQNAAVRGDEVINKQKLKKLTKVVLYPRSAIQAGKASPYKVSDFNGKPIKTVHLEYATATEELMKGAPNAATNRGRLTLKRVHFTYNGITPARLRPYTFGYQYPQGLYPSRYAALDNYASGLDQNPKYSIHNSDAWGNYQPNGEQHHRDFRTWVDQSNVPNQFEDPGNPANDPSKLFDPAVWHLKKITLPSGGQIHVQYESDDYNYVQDQEAHVMVPLLGAAGANGKAQAFKLDTRQIGVTTNEELDELVRMINERYVETDKKIYFKFLYRLKAPLTDQFADPDISSCNVDYVTGYADVIGVSKSGAEVILTLDNADKLPWDVCTEFVKRQRKGMINTDNCDAEDGGLQDADDANEVVLGLTEFWGRRFLPDDEFLCQRLDPNLSYFRVPTPRPKRGGGLRVKRLLTFDNTLEGSVLYGNEYLYKTFNENGRKISSGVATNEPATMREENILVDFIKRKGQNDIQKLLYGEDKKQSEGPIGESILPGPSVGYSKVIIKNIHQGQTTTGYAEYDYLTAKDYPVKIDRTPINDSRQSNDIVYTGFLNKFKNHQYTTQGFTFTLNSMHGQNSRMATYAGRYVDLETTQQTPPVTEKINVFYEPGSYIPVMDELYGEVTQKNPGREVDVTVAQKRVTESSKDLNISLDFTVGLTIIPIPWLTGWPTISTTDGELYTHATAKVIRYPAVLKKSVNYQDGIYHTNENVAFSESTGQPVAVKSYDEFSGAYLSQQVPAEWEYNNFKQKAHSERLVLNANDELQMTAEWILVPPIDGFERVSWMKIYFTGTEGCEALAKLNLGDLIELTPGSLHHITHIDFAADVIRVRPSAMTNASFLQGTVDRMSVIRSGRNNNLNQSAGNITFHDADHTLMDIEDIAIDDAQRFIRGGNSAIDGSKLISNLNNAFTNQIVGTSGSFSTMAGPFHGMNISTYTVSCDVDVYNATIRNVNFDYFVEDGAVKLVLKSFCADCDDRTDCLIIE